VIEDTAQLPLEMPHLAGSRKKKEARSKWGPLKHATAHHYADCHIHSSLCGHAENSLAEMLEGIKMSGLHSAIFTEHLPLPEAVDPKREVSMYPEQLLPYVATLREAVEEFDHARSCGEAAPRLIVGAEADWLNDDIEWSIQSVKEARAAGIDVILGSIHMLDEWAFDDPAQVDVWDRSDVDEVWDWYFSEWIKAVKAGIYDVMAHPDLPKKFNFIPDDPRQYYTEAAEAIAEAGILCEVSTQGLRRPCKELYPSQGFMKELVARDVGLTLASDAHAVSEIGYGFDYAVAQMLAAGAEHYLVPYGSVFDGDYELFSLDL